MCQLFQSMLKVGPAFFRAAAIGGLLVAAIPRSSLADSAGRVEHVVVVVWDGLRPDSVNEQDTPTLFRLAAEGTTFANQHPVYLSSTEVNGTALATGCYPQNTGIVGNREYRSEIQKLDPFDTQSPDRVREGDQLTNGHYINRLTMAEILQRTGRWTVVAGTKPVALLLDRHARSDGVGISSVLFQGKTLPESLGAFVVGSRGPFPQQGDSTKNPNAGQDKWTTQALTEQLWANGVPALTMLWLSEPDYAQHGSGPNSEVARKALRSSDENLARVLQSLEDRKLRDKTDIFVVSDHGFSTISQPIDIVAELEKSNEANRLHKSNKMEIAAFRSFPSAPIPGQVMVVGNGGTVCLYVVGHDKRTVQQIVEFLQESDFAGVIFCRFDIEGTFPLSAAEIDAPTAPDIVVSLRWSAQRSGTGMPGLEVSDIGKLTPDMKRGKAGQGMHASLSRFDMHNTLIAAGPSIRRGFLDTLPSGNADVAPTVLAVLGVASPAEMDGRVLEEALAGHDRYSCQLTAETLEATHHGQKLNWRQYLHVTRLGRQVYLDEGNGETLPAE
jgi:predicted AlkP superfamily pyrophosphatase or phosphodiesterase